MSSINAHYTFQYSQPEEYRFSHDSVFLARRVFEIYAQKSVQKIKGLDLCSGCGIVGLDFLFHCQKEQQMTPASFDFVEVQEIYQAHFAENVKRFGPTSTPLQFLHMNYQELLTSSKKYDLILSNPPYFRQGQGKMSPSEFKNRCRFFLDADFPTLLKVVENSLAENGEAFLLLRNLEEHGWNALKEAQKILSYKTKIEKIDDIRGTDLVRISFH